MTRRGADGRPPDAGAGTVLVLAVCAALIVVGAGLGVLGEAVVARHRAEAAADLAALAAADVLVGRALGDPCGRATRTAALNGARLRACAVSGGTVEVVAEVRVTLGPARARARAGPAPNS